jgi:hypothetical protein
MNVGDMIEQLQQCSHNAKIKIIEEKELECMPQWWDEDNGKVAGNATIIYREDLHSHYFYVLAIRE